MGDLKLVPNVKNMKCTGLKAVSYPDTRKKIKGSTVQFSTDTRIFLFSVMGWRLILYQNVRKNKFRTNAIEKNERT